MSADNYIFVDRKKKPIEVWSCVASQVSNNIEDQKSYLIGKTKTLEEAINLAEKYEKEIEREGLYIEYGISFYLWWK